MKVLTWNVNRAAESRTGLWETLRREDADIVIMQEVGRIPDWILSHYGGNCHSRNPRYSADGEARFQTVVLSKCAMDRRPVLVSDLAWVNRIQAECYGSILECEVVSDKGERFRIVSVYSPFFPVPREFLVGVDVSSIRLKNNRSLFFTEILWSLLRNANVAEDANWIVAGDFNSSEKFDFPKNTGNREIMDRLNALGLRDCLSQFKKKAVPTFQNARNRVVEHQLDYCYANRPMLQRLTMARVLRREEVFDRVPRLSDHLPILCEFD